jgi:peptidoglycan-N-acetylglucosamine deacetylase
LSSARTSIVVKKAVIGLCALFVSLSLTQCTSGGKTADTPPPEGVFVPTVSPKPTVRPNSTPRTALPRGTAAPDTARPTPSVSASASPSASASSGDSTATPSPSESPTSSFIPAHGEDDKVLYFTFDDGPNPPYTTEILDILAKHKAHGTFFALGEAVNDHPDILKQIRAAGHAVGNHTHDHRSLPSLSTEDVRRELTTGPQSKCFRPPYGAINDRVREVVTGLGAEVVMWDVDPRDWDKPGADTIVDRVVADVYPGAIILLHDGGGDRSQTVEALERLLTKLGEDGYTFEALIC